MRSTVKPDHIHEVGDGRGFREVWLDGEKLERVVYADTDAGIARVIDIEQTKRAADVVTSELRGKVVVKFL